MQTEQTESPKNIDEYIAGFPPDVQRMLGEVRKVIREAAPDAVEAIKYRMPTFVLGENLVHFAAYQKHVGFYPTPDGISTFQDELARYKGAKGSVQFPLDEPMPLGLVRRIVEFRVAQVRAKAGVKRKK